MNSNKTKSRCRERNKREGGRGANTRAVRCGKCADLGDNYCKLNPSPVPCMAMRRCSDRSGSINISCISARLVKATANPSGIVVPAFPWRIVRKCKLDKTIQKKRHQLTLVGIDSMLFFVMQVKMRPFNANLTAVSNFGDVFEAATLPRRF